MAGFRLTALAALVCFCLLAISRFAGAQNPIFSLVSTPVPVPATTSVPESTTTTTPTPSPTSTSSSTSPAPSPTATTSSSSSSSSPTPTPTPPAHSFFLYNETENALCVLVVASVQLDVSYKNSTSGKAIHKSLMVTGNLNGTVDDSSSFCGRTHTNLTLLFHNDSAYNHTLTFAFETTKDGYDLKVTTSLDFDDSKLFPGYNTSSYPVDVMGVTGSVFSTSTGKSYKCGSSKNYGMKVTNNTVQTLSVKISGFQAQAFSDSQGGFDKATSCTKDQKTSKVVPIAVGAALAGLVVVVLIAYLIGRFRSRKQNSYEALS